MNLKYENVPDMISGKDLDYLTDMFNWNYHAFKESIDYANATEKEDLIKLLDKATNLFNSNMEDILSILERGGVNG